MSCVETASLIDNEVRGNAPVRVPAHVLAAAQPRSSVLEMVAASDDSPLFSHFLCKSAGPALMLPCLWPVLCCALPCIVGGAKTAEYDARSRVLLLTQGEVISLSLGHDLWCCPGCSRSGTEVKNIPLEQITDLALDQQGRGCVQRYCMPDVSTRERLA